MEKFSGDKSPLSPYVPLFLDKWFEISLSQMRIYFDNLKELANLAALINFAMNIYIQVHTIWRHVAYDFISPRRPLHIII